MCKLTSTLYLVFSIILFNAQITVSSNLRLTGAVFLNVDGDFDGLVNVDSGRYFVMVDDNMDDERYSMNPNSRYGLDIVR